jgi:hypothetical protein
MRILVVVLSISIPVFLAALLGGVVAPRQLALTAFALIDPDCRRVINARLRALFGVGRIRAR